MRLIIFLVMAPVFPCYAFENSLFFPCLTGNSAWRRVRSRLAPQPASPGITVFSGPCRKTPAFPAFSDPKPNRRRSLAAPYRRERACRLHLRIGGSVWGGFGQRRPSSCFCAAHAIGRSTVLIRRWA